MIYAQEVLDYIVATKDEVGSMLFVAKELKMSYEATTRLYQYQKGLMDGTLVIVQPSTNTDPEEGTVTLEMLRNGWYGKRSGRKWGLSHVASVSRDDEIWWAEHCFALPESNAADLTREEALHKFQEEHCPKSVDSRAEKSESNDGRDTETASRDLTPEDKSVAQIDNILYPRPRKSREHKDSKENEEFKQQPRLYKDSHSPLFKNLSDDISLLVTARALSDIDSTGV